MLDLNTIFLLDAVSTSLQSIVWMFVWLTWRRLYELNFISAGFMCMALGLLMMMLGGPQPPGWVIVLDNALITFGVVLLADGLARFLGQPRHPWFGRAVMAAQLVFWTGAVALVPDDVVLRVHAFDTLTVVILSFMCLTLLRDRSQPATLRYMTILILFEQMAASVARSIVEILYVPNAAEMTSIMDNRNAWYFFQGTIFVTLFFACMFFMVGNRLTADLRAKNAQLIDELSERKRLESQLAISLDAEKSLLDEQYQFMRMVSHEFRTPLAIVQRAGEMIRLLLKRSSPDITPRLDSIDGAVGRLTALLDRFITTDRKSAELLQLEDLDITALLNALDHHFELTGQSARLHIETVPRLPRLNADADMLTTVLINLVDNALKYSNNGSRVRVVAALEEGAILLTVIDHGIGIPAHEQANVGRRFFRASNVGTTGGTGMGLYNCHRLLSYHNATLELKPMDNGGTAAIVRLPVEYVSKPQLDTGATSISTYL